MIKEALQKEYQSKLITVEEAAGLVKSGDKISYFNAGVAPIDIDKALAARMPELTGLTLYTMGVRAGGYEIMKAAESAEQLRTMSSHFNGNDRKEHNAGRLWHMPIMYSELTRYLREVYKPDILFCQVSPMDEWGNFIPGHNLADFWGNVDGAKTVVVEVNKNLHVARGVNNIINISDIDYIVEGSHSEPANSWGGGGELDEIDLSIGNQVAAMIESGSTIQFGVGNLPGAIGHGIIENDDIKEVYCHTEVMGEAYADMFDAGKLVGSKTSIDHPGRIVYANASSTPRVLDLATNNPICLSAPIEYVNAYKVVANIPKFVSVNSCINVDILGQVSSESVGFQHISGTGGQLDFVLGAYASEGGKSFICFRSARKNKDGELESNIIPVFKPGTVVTTPRSCVHYLATEYGVVQMKGLSTWQRAEALVSLAHPDFREQLIKDAERAGVWTNTSKSDWV